MYIYIYIYRMFSRTRVHPVAASGETNTDSNRGVLERGAPPREEEGEEFIFNEADYFDIPERSQDSIRLRRQENDIRKRENSLQRKLPKLKSPEIRRRQDSIKLLQDALNQQKENIEKKRIQRKERIIAEMEAERAEMEAERAEMEAERLAEINRPPPSYYSSSPVPVPAPTVQVPTVPAPTVPAPTVPVPTVPVPTVPVPVVRRPWYHRLADRIDNADWNRAAPPTAAQIARRRARRTRREEAALRREERSKKSLKEAQDELQKQKYEDQKDLLEKLYIKYPNKSIPDKEFPVYSAYHKTLNPAIRRIPKPYSYEEEDNKKRDKNPNETETKKKRNPNLLKKIKRLLTQKNVIPRKKSPVPPPKSLTPPPDYSPGLPPAYSSRGYKLRSTQSDYNAGGGRSRKKKTRRVKRS